MPDEAVNHLRAAHDYLTHIGDDLPDHPETAKHQFLYTLQTVTKHIQNARKLDPDAVYNYIDPKTNEVFPQSVDDLAGRSFIGKVSSNPNGDEKRRSRRYRHST